MPTLAESGVPGFDASSWNGMSVPAGTPRAVVDKLAQEAAKAVASPEVQKELQAVGMVARASTPESMSESHWFCPRRYQIWVTGVWSWM